MGRKLFGKGLRASAPRAPVVRHTRYILASIDLSRIAPYSRPMPKAHEKRWIIHLDMDAFFASVEQLDNPAYRGKPVIVGGTERGVVSTCSYEARKFGVHSAMPIFMARNRCPHAIFVRGRMERYQEKSREIMASLHDFSPLVEQASVDEAYIDATGLEGIFGPIETLAAAIHARVYEVSGLTCSLGAAPVKFLAKITSELKKPAGISFLYHEDVPAFVERLPIGKIPGVGKQTLAVLEGLGVQRAGDMMRYPPEFWTRKLGKTGTVLFARAQGIDPRPVDPCVEAKSESAENTFREDTADATTLTRWLLAQAERVGGSLRRHNTVGRTITLKIKYADFTQITRSRTLKKPTNSTRTIYETAVSLLQEEGIRRPVRLIGVGVSQFGAQTEQLSLLPDEHGEQEQREAALDTTLDEVRQRFGRGAIVRGKLFRG